MAPSFCPRVPRVPRVGGVGVRHPLFALITLLFLALVLVISVLPVSTATGPLDAAASSSSSFSTIVGQTAMVSTTHYLATESAIEVLKRGGNAADASAVIQFVLTVVQPQSTGLGGGCIILHYDATEHSVVALDGREEAPAAFHGRQFCANPDCLTNPACNCDSGLLPTRDSQTGGHPVS